MNRAAAVAVFRLFFAGLTVVAIAVQLISLAGKGTLDPVNYFSYFTIDSNLIATGVLIAIYRYVSKNASDTQDLG